MVGNYKSAALVSLGKAPSEISHELRLYYYLGLMCRDTGFSTYCKGTKLGKLIYNSQVFSESAIQYVYDLHVKEWKLSTKYIDLEEQSLTLWLPRFVNIILVCELTSSNLNYYCLLLGRTALQNALREIP